MLILSLFPGIGLLDMAFEEYGFTVVRGPDILWGGDIRKFNPPAGRFDGIIGGPPCQSFSRLRHLVEAKGLKVAENLIPEFERVVNAAQPDWFLMENVPAAPSPNIEEYSISSVKINNRWFGGEQSRERVFSFGVKGDVPVRLEKFLQFEALENIEWSPTVCASGGVKPGISGDNRKRAKNLGWKTTAALKESLRLQGLPDDFLSQSPFTLQGKHKVVGNGVPLPLGMAVAKAVKSAVEASTPPPSS
jgi:DNA (cytosine-5)-methyltransferase 1